MGVNAGDPALDGMQCPTPLCERGTAQIIATRGELTVAAILLS